MPSNENLKPNLFAPPSDEEVAIRQEARRVYLEAHPEEKPKGFTLAAALDLQSAHGFDNALVNDALDTLQRRVAEAFAVPIPITPLDAYYTPQTLGEVKAATYGKSPALFVAPALKHWLTFYDTSV